MIRKKMALSKLRVLLFYQCMYTPKLWRLVLFQKQLQLLAWYFLVWEFWLYSFGLWNQVLNYRNYFCHIQKYFMSAVHLDKQVSRFNKFLNETLINIPHSCLPAPSFLLFLCCLAQQSTFLGNPSKGASNPSGVCVLSASGGVRPCLGQC